MTVNERVKYLREDLKMSQAKFAESLGVGQTTISYIEKSGSTVKEQHLRLICKTHRVNYFWLTEGIGDPYLGPPSILSDEVIQEYHLKDDDKEIIERYIKLDPEERELLKKLLVNIIKAPD